MTASCGLRWRATIRGLFICAGVIFFSSPLCAHTLPAGTTLEARLSTSTGSLISRPGDPVEATIIAPVVINGQLLVPQQSKISGSVQNVSRFGFGLKHVTASIQYRFDALQLPDGHLIPINTEVLEVETAKERVDGNGVVHGIHPAASLTLCTVSLSYLQRRQSACQSGE